MTMRKIRENGFKSQQRRVFFYQPMVFWGKNGKKNAVLLHREMPKRTL